MNMYEFTFLVEEESEVAAIKQLLESLDGKITHEEKWGQRALAYPIDKHGAALFYTWHIEVAAPRMAEFKKKLAFNEKLMRYLLVRN